MMTFSNFRTKTVRHKVSKRFEQMRYISANDLVVLFNFKFPRYDARIQTFKDGCALQKE